MKWDHFIRGRYGRGIYNREKKYFKNTGQKNRILLYSAKNDFITNVHFSLSPFEKSLSRKAFFFGN